MTTLTRYLLREILVPLGVLVALTVVVGATSQLLRAASEISGIGVPLGALLAALPLAMPSLFSMGMPVAFMLSMLVAFGRMAEERELLALAASGVSMRRLLVVPLAIGVTLTVVGVFMTLWAEPRAIVMLRSMLADAAAGYFGDALDPGVLHDQVPGVTIYFGEKDKASGRLAEIVLIDERDPASPNMFIAESGSIDKRDGALRFVLSHGEVHMGRARDTAYRRVRFDELVWRVEPGPLIRRLSRQIPSINAMPFTEVRQKALDPQLEAHDRAFYMVSFHRKFTFPLANLVFVLLAFPITTIYNRTSRLIIYGAVAIMTALYFTVTQSIDPMVKTLGLLPEQAAWAPNIFFGGIGLVLTAWRLRR